LESHENYKEAFTTVMQKTIGKHNLKLKNQHIGRAVIKQIDNKEKFLN
jgi:hypothetical protein